MNVIEPRYPAWFTPENRAWLESLDDSEGRIIATAYRGTRENANQIRA